MIAIRKRCITHAACALALVTLAGCKRESNDGREPGAALRGGHRAGIAVLMDSRTSPERFTQAEYLQSFALPRPEVRLVIFDAEGSATVQAHQLAEAMADKPEFLLVFPVDGKSITPHLVELKRNGTKIIAFDTQFSAEACTTMIIKDEKAIGRVAGDFILNALRQKAADEGRTPVTGRIVRLTAADSSSSRKRDDGLTEALVKEPGIMIVHEAPCGNIGNEAAPRLEEAIRIQKNFDVIYADNDYIAAAAAKALDTFHPGLRDKLLIMGTGGAFGSNGGIGMVIDSKIDATIYDPPLVDVAWSLVMQCVRNPTFQMKPRYLVHPAAISLEKALELSREGRIKPVIE